MPKMPTRPQGGEPQAGGDGGGEGAGRPSADAAVGAALLAGLGRPKDLYRVAVVPLWKGHYRVNVLTGADAATVRIAHSFFVTADEGGKVTGSTPAVTKLYD